MADALSSSFDEWIRSLLNDLQSDNVDMSDFVEYFLSIVTSDSETDEEKKMAIAELLGDLDSKVNKTFPQLLKIFLLSFISIIIVLINLVNKFLINGIHLKIIILQKAK
jgi:hypothetical protein